MIRGPKMIMMMIHYHYDDDTLSSSSPYGLTGLMMIAFNHDVLITNTTATLYIYSESSKFVDSYQYYRFSEVYKYLYCVVVCITESVTHSFN